MKRIFCHWASRVLREQEQDLNYKDHIPYQFTVYDCLNYILYIFPLALGFFVAEDLNLPEPVMWAIKAVTVCSLDCFFLTSKSPRSSQRSDGHRPTRKCLSCHSVSFISCGDQCFIFIGVNSHCSFVHSDMLGMC